MKKKIFTIAVCTMAASAIFAGCGSSSGTSDAGTDNTDYQDYECDGYDSYDSYYEDDGYYYSGNDNKRQSILTDPSDYEYGSSSKYNNETAVDTRYTDATLMYSYEGRTYSSDQVALQFRLTDVSSDGNQIQVVFDKCQYDLSGIDLGSTYSGYLQDIVGGSYVSMDGYYLYAVPFMDLWEDGSRHEDTFFLEFSFGSTDPKGEFCMSEIGLLSDTMYMI